MRARPLLDTNYIRFRNLIMRHTGLDFPPSRRDDLATGLRYALNKLQEPADLEDTGPLVPYEELLEALYAALSNGNSVVWDAVIEALTVCETHFFRNVPQFTALRNHVLPALIADKRQAKDLSLRIWSAGCATGEEAYSLAILVRQLLPDWPQWQLDILGTDLNKQALDTARKGLYRNWSFREGPAQQWRDSYFHKIGTQYQLRDDVRIMVHFAGHNLAQKGQRRIAYQDLILCRNVMLYFGTRVRRIIYRRLYDALAPGRWLVVGHADPQPTDFAEFKAQNFSGVSFYQRPASSPAHSKASHETRQLLPVSDLGDGPAPPMTLTGDNVTDAEAHYRLGRWYANRQNWDKAEQHCAQAITLEPTHTGAHYVLALIHQHRGAKDLAIESLRRTIYLAGDWVLPRFILAGLYRQIGETLHARRELRNVINMTTALPPDTPLSGGEGLTAARLRAAAERQFQQVAASPGNAPLDNPSDSTV